MDRYPLLWNGAVQGELQLEKDHLYLRFTAHCCPPEEQGMWCIWLVGEKSELRLGVLEPSEGELRFSRRLSCREVAAAGPLLRAELRPVSELHWTAAPQPEKLVRAPGLQRQLCGRQGVLTRSESGKRYLAVPYDRSRPFPMPELFCFARLRRIGTEEYIVFILDERDWPVFS